MMKILDHYIDQLLDKSTPQAPVWNIEKIKNGGASTWNYIDGCMIKAILELYHITRNGKYLEFADAFIDYFVQEDGSITSYDPKEYNLDNVNAGKTLFDLYELTGRSAASWRPSPARRRATSGTRRSIPTRSGWTALTWPSPSICSTK